jgi:hypothetical protein
MLPLYCILSFFHLIFVFLKDYMCILIHSFSYQYMQFVRHFFYKFGL